RQPAVVDEDEHATVVTGSVDHRLDRHSLNHFCRRKGRMHDEVDDHSVTRGGDRLGLVTQLCSSREVTSEKRGKDRTFSRRQ
ncbi:MAG: hypothetical protein QOI76_3599, partial [Frankiales bacterium]|nr:hypothetical protein [Frankiales bacterium]